MTFEARLAFIIFFFLIWTLLGLLPWAAAALVTRGRGAALALPLAVSGACAFGVFVPAIGLRDGTGLLLSLVTAPIGATIGSIAGIAIWMRLDAARPDTTPRRVPPLTKRPERVEGREREL